MCTANATGFLVSDLDMASERKETTGYRGTCVKTARTDKGAGEGEQESGPRQARHVICIADQLIVSAPQQSDM